ncbi:LexA repressor [Serratia marcescens]|uniref:LexA family protein n=1 Tax=Serratia marcescens TaxID=615 RepID=UPI00217BC091|nr:hypothetical protein [Serratia marcescens]CAI1535714.1 LexA repressor [Serratia marcescens]
MTGLTLKQGEVLSFITQFIADNGCPPTRVEIADGFGWSSPNAAEIHLKGLCTKGAIIIIPGISRGIRVQEGYKEVTITRAQFRQVCDALINATNLNEQLLLLSTADKRSEKIHHQANKLLQTMRQQLSDAVGERE